MKLNLFFALLMTIILISFTTAFGQSTYELRALSKVERFVVNENGIKINTPVVLTSTNYFVFCPTESPQVSFEVVSDVDSLHFFVQENDTIVVVVDFQERENFNINIIGVNKLPNNLEISDKLFYLSKIYSEAKFNFVNLDRLSFDIDSLFQTAIQKVLLTKNDYSFYHELKRFLAMFNEGHTEVYDGGKFYPYMGYVPLVSQEIQNRIYIINVREDLASYFEPGDEILEINKVPVDSFIIDSIMPFISGSTHAFRREIAVGRLFSGLKESPLVITWKNSKGEIMQASFSRNGEETRYDRFGNEKFERVGARRFKRNLDLDFLADSIAVLELNAFWPEDFVIQELNNLMPRISKAKGLVIDLRNNRGGSTTVAHELLKKLLHQEYFWGLEAETRVNDAVYRALGLGYEEYSDYYKGFKYRIEETKKIFIPDTIAKINCPVVILIGSRTFSAAEDFLIMLYEIENRPLLIGNETAGSTGLPLVIPGLPYDGYARITARRVIFPQSKDKFVNKGIVPDIIIEPNLQEVINGDDVVLEMAIKVLRNR
ncbi:MAG: hypothetical protein PWQ54_2105 [Bacteroidales bacterium]|nr:hypothetical protein [Bacteroidales bacterium]